MNHIFSELTPDLQLDVVERLAEWVGGLALVAPAVRLLRRLDLELGADMLELSKVKK